MEQDQSYLAEEKVGRLMRKYAVPCIISLLVGALYNIVDQIFIANASYLGSYGNAANTVVFPLTVIALAVAVMIGDGCCAFVSLNLGCGNKKDAGNSPVGVYTITVAVDTNKTLNNYTISVTGTASYNITKRALTVTVNDQNVVYDPEGNYAFDVNGWRITEGRLASGESNSVLNVVLTKPEITNAGSYEITAAYTNSNYEVTIVKGNYNVSKLNLPDNDQTVFELYIDGDYFDPDKIYTYSGTALELTAHVYYLLSPETEIGVKVDPSSIAEAGYITVTVTVEDPNYSGERTYTVTVVGEDGLTPRLKEVLESLEALCGDLTIDTLSSTEENFTKLKQAQSLIDSLTEEEKESGAETLAPYTELLQAWNRASELDEGVISTAKAIADAPLKGLLAAVNALLAAVYAALKGGIRK